MTELFATLFRISLEPLINYSSSPREQVIFYLRVTKEEEAVDNTANKRRQLGTED